MPDLDTSPVALRALAAAALNTIYPPVAGGFVEHVAATLRTLADEKEATAGPLVYRSYACTPSHAVECAYLLSLAEAEYARDPSSDADEGLGRYARGDVSIEEAMDALAAPDQPEDPPMTDANPSTAAENAAEQYIAAAIDRGSGCARRLGKYLADHLDDDNFGPADRMLLGLVEQMNAAVERAEKAEAERGEAWRDGYRACVDTVLSYRAHYDWGPRATAQDGAEIAMQAIKDCVVRSAERAGVDTRALIQKEADHD